MNKEQVIASVVVMSALAQEQAELAEELNRRGLPVPEDLVAQAREMAAGWQDASARVSDAESALDTEPLLSLLTRIEPVMRTTEARIVDWRKKLAKFEGDRGDDPNGDRCS